MLRDLPALLPTPAVNDMGAGKDPQWWDDWAARQKASDGRPAPHGKSLEQEALRLLPTPTAQAAKHGSTPDVTAHGFGSNLWDLPTLIGASLTQESISLLPTPTVAADRKSRKSMVEDAQWAAPGLAQAVEIAQGILPREFRDWSEVPGHSGASTPPRSTDGSTPSAGQHPTPPSQVPTDDHDSPLYLWNG